MSSDFFSFLLLPGWAEIALGETIRTRRLTQFRTNLSTNKTRKKEMDHGRILRNQFYISQPKGHIGNTERKSFSLSYVLYI